MRVEPAMRPAGVGLRRLHSQDLEHTPGEVQQARRQGDLEGAAGPRALQRLSEAVEEQGRDHPRVE